MEETAASRRRRGKGAEAAARASALERLKALRLPGARRSEAIKIEAPIYDTVAEDDYAALVAKRRQTYGDFIIDDDGLGYGDEGEEEDWEQSGAPPSDESEEESGNPKKKKKEKKELPPKKPSSSLSAAASLMGKQRISSMFTSSVFKAKGAPASESIVDDVIAEFAPDETDREKRRRVTFNSSMGARNSAAVIHSREEKPAVFVDSVLSSEHTVVVSADSNSLSKEENNRNESSCIADAPMDLKEDVNSDSKVVVDQIPPNKTSDSNVIEVKLEEVKSEKTTLNAKVKEEIDPALSASAEWKAVRGGDGCDGGVATHVNSDDKSDFELNSEGSLLFYMIDAYEEINGANMGNLYLFGKVKAGSANLSCCVIVKNMQRCIYAIPTNSVFPDNTITELEMNVSESKLSPAAFRTKLLEMSSQLKNEISQSLLDLNVSNFSMQPVKRGYAFERSDIPTGENYVLKVNYPFKDPPLPSDLKGRYFSAVLGTHNSALELFLVKRKIKGPSWLSISKFVSCPVPQRVSWCKFEVSVDCPKDIRVLSSKAPQETPSVVVTAINLKTIINEKYNASEIVTASVICCNKAKVDSPMVPSEWKRPGILSHFTVVRKPDNGIFPLGFAKDVADINSKASSVVLATESSERALLNRLLIELHKLDSDILVGHNISGFDLDVLLHRAQACKVPSSMWSKIGRLKRSVMPKLSKGTSIFGSGASPGIISCIAGRLLCDTYLCSRDLLKEVSYTLTQLAKTQLNKDRKEVSPHDIPAMFEKSGSLLELVEYGETDAWLSLELMFHLSILPLTRQLTNISGNLWSKTLQGARAQRVEYLLLHEFHGKKYMVPDKITRREKELSSTKKRANTADGEDHANDFENDAQDIGQGKGKKGPAYAGGLVLEPKKGLYDKYILLLDFNSLYPSIIQEYNICFTTVQRSQDGLVPSLPSSKTTGLLPKLLKFLVERRKSVKKFLKTASGLKIQQLDIQQQALKLTANSIYGCLGFSNSRFYAKQIAELITLQGREILQSTVDLVQNNLNLEVIYGDTDSIMIYSGLDDFNAAKVIAGKVIQEVNKKYHCLEIDLDGLYRRMLLLKKKKYAAVKVLFKDGTPYEVIERKGLDMVRRDWSLISKELGDFCLTQILSGGSCEDVVESIHASLMKVQEEMRNGEVALEKYIITKTLTKPPEDYPDAKNQPHVQVALRLKRGGLSSGCSAGDTVPYIICCEQGSSTSSSTGIAQRARHPEELKKEKGNWIIDIDYYLSQQIHPVISRLCASIQGTSPARLADCLGLDSSKFQSKTAEDFRKDESSALLGIVDDEERYRGCEPFWLSCPSCSSAFECPPVSTLFKSSSNEIQTNMQAEKESCHNFWQKMQCRRCRDADNVIKISSAMIANQAKRQAEKFISTYYEGQMTCDDELCKYTTRSLNLRLIGDSEKGTVCPNYPRCVGHLVRKYTEADLYRQLSYFCHVLDVDRCIEKLDYAARIPLEKEFIRIRQEADLAYSTVRKIRDRSAYGWVNLKDLSASL